ncbi:MAG: hypothetical protein QOC66_133 [Pseudonocardiales bacterium]|nr:hypothetical protein [Pseudonocardiales bacterium]
MLARIRTIRPVGFIVGFVAAIVVTGGGVAAYAANGGSVLIGRSNYGTAVTTLTNTAGTPLRLQAGSTAYPPFSVNSPKMVTSLNSDMLGNWHGISYAFSAMAHTGNITADSDWAPNDVTGVPDPTTHTLIAVATCPSGTKLTGGGYDNYTTGVTFINSADTNSWVVISDANPDATPTPDAPTDLTAYAVCYNPRGAVSGAQTNARTAKPALSATVQAKLARIVAKNSK